MIYPELSIIELLLDQENPRLGTVQTQSQALEALVNLDPNHFKTIMRSIREHGLDPGDFLYVIAENDEFIVLDGNRRLSAIQVLSNPDLLEGTNLGEQVKKSLRNISLGYDRESVEPIRCVQFSDRFEANGWIERRHTGTANGEGRVGWGFLEIQNFKGDKSTLDVIRFVEQNGAFNDDEWKKMKPQLLSKKSSNLDRLLTSKAGQQHLGISYKTTETEKVPLTNSDPEWMVQVLKQLFNDVYNGTVDSRTHNKSSQIERYFANLPEDLQPTETRVEPRPFRDLASTNGTKLGFTLPTNSLKPVKPAVSKNVPKPRTTLAPKKVSFTVPKDTKFAQLLHEASKTKTSDFCFSSAFLLRSLLEFTFETYLADNGLPRYDEQGKAITTGDRASKIYDHILAQSSATRNDLSGFKTHIMTKNSPTSIQSLNEIVHSKHHTPTGESLRVAFDSCVPIFLASFGKVV